MNITVSDPIQVVLLAIGLSLCVFTGLVSWQRRSTAGALLIVIISLLGIIVLIALLLMGLATSDAAAFFWLRVRWITQLLTLTFLMLFVLTFSGHTEWLRPRRIWVFFVPSLIGVAASLNPDAFAGYTFVRQDFLLYERYAVGQWLNLGLILHNLLVALMLGILAQMILRSRPPYRGQAVILFFVLVVMLILNSGLFNTFSDPDTVFALNPAVINVPLRALLFAWALFGFHFLDVMPISAHMILADIKAAMLALDSRYRVVSINAVAARLAGTRPLEAIGRPVRDVFPAISRVLAGYDGDKEHVAEVSMTHDEKHWYYECHLNPIYSGDKRRVGHLVWMADITNRKQAEAAIRKLTLAVEQSPISIVITNRKGIIEYVNTHFVNLTGYSLAESIGQNPRFLRTEYTPSETHKSLWETILEGQTWTGEFRNRKKNGELYWESATVGPVIDENGQITDFVAVKEDITARKAAEAERERLIGDLTAFAHTVAHDLKNPVAVLLGMTEVLLDDSYGVDEAERRELLGTIQKTSFKMRDIIHELLLLSSVRTLDEVPIGPLNMQEIVASVLERLSILVREAGAHIRVQTDLPPSLGYGPWIEEVWVNYLTNAVKYGGTPPMITIGAGPGPNSMVRYWVRDNGRGLTSEEQARLFQEFSRLDQTRAEGHGLGLSIVRRILEKLEGQFGAERDPAGGSTFHFSLRAVPESHS